MKNSRLLILLLTVIPTFVYCQDSLVLKWGLESTRYFEEMQVGKAYNSAIRIPAEEGDTLYRFFTTNQKYEKVIMTIFARHNKLWDLYRESIGKESEPDKKDFISYARREDPYYLGLTKEMAPVLYFDFIGVSKEYVLESIEIETIDFGEYMGGGFYQKNAWYDIELKHELGKHKYDVDKKLRFVGSGRAELRFWSDNYYKYMGMSPMGCYVINIKFNFICDGSNISVQTNPFKIDV